MNCRLILLLGLLGSIFTLPNALADPRIIGGEPATISDHPWMAALVSSQAPNPAEGLFCGASLIAPQWVMTAAHCLFGLRPDDLYVLLGADDLSSPQSGESIEVTAIIMHPTWLGENGPSGETLEDIALIKLATPSRQTPITPALGSQSAAFPTGTPVTVSGWGTRSTDEFDMPLQLHAVDLEVVDDAACNLAYENPGLTETSICAAAVERGACSGDSGGPLSARIGDTPVLVGVVSGGGSSGCASDIHPDIYTRVSAFESFVDAAMRQSVSTDEHAFFGTAFPGLSRTATVTYQNLSSEVELVLGNVRTTGTNDPVTVGTENCSAGALAPQSSCTIEVNWTPTQPVDKLQGLLKVDVFDGSETRTLYSHLLGTSLTPVSNLAQPLDVPENNFYVDEAIDWERASDESARGGAAIQTIELGVESDSGGAILWTRLATLFQDSGTVSFNYQSLNAEIVVFVDGKFSMYVEPDREPSAQWKTVEVEVGDQSVLEWIIAPNWHDAIVALDAVTYTAADIPAEDDSNSPSADQTGTQAGTGAGVEASTHADADSDGSAAAETPTGGSSGSGAFWPVGLLFLAGLSLHRRRGRNWFSAPPGR